jgi:hypothetical protein
LVAGACYEDVEISSRDALRDSAGAPVIGADGRFVTDASAPRQIAFAVDGLLWDVGVLWRPSSRTSLQAAVGRRYDSTTYYGTFTYAPSERSAFAVSAYDGVSGFGGVLNNSLARLDNDFQAVRNPVTGDFGGLVSGTEGQALIGGVGSVRSAAFRGRGVNASYQREMGRTTAAIGAAEAYRYPKLTISGNFYIATTGTDGLADLGNRAYSIGPSLYLPLFTGGRIDATVNQKRAEAEAALAQYRGAVISAVGDVSACASDFVHARETRRRSDSALASSEAALALAQQQYDAGVIDYATLLDVQRGKLSAESTAVEARAGVVQGYIALQRALGAGWDAEEQAVQAAMSAESTQSENAR